jgi:small-conductance mechanosensitive channel
LLDWLHSTLPAVPGVEWPRVLGATVVAALVLAILWLARRIARRHHARLARTEATEVLEIPLLAAGRTTLAFMLAAAAYAGVAAYGLEGTPARLALKIVTIGSFWQAGLWVSTAAVAWLDRRRRTMLAHGKAVVGSISIIRFVARVLIWAMVLLLTLDNLGVDITALVAGLGIGGIAVALALQNVLGDLLASLSIALDQPFATGDFLAVGEHLGTVEHIGIKTTRLRSLTGEQIVMSNADLLGSRLRNYGRMSERRVVFSLGVTYETPRAKLREIAPLLRRIISEQEGVRFDRAHFASYGAYSLDFEVVYHVLTPDYGRYMDLQQDINFRIHEAFERLGVEFAYPTQTLVLSGASPRRLAVAGGSTGRSA